MTTRLAGTACREILHLHGKTETECVTGSQGLRTNIMEYVELLRLNAAETTRGEQMRLCETYYS